MRSARWRSFSWEKSNYPPTVRGRERLEEGPDQVCQILLGGKGTAVLSGKLDVRDIL